MSLLSRPRRPLECLLGKLCGDRDEPARHCRRQIRGRVPAGLESWRL